MRDLLLAPNEVIDFGEVIYPQYAFIKYDGVRCLMHTGALLSRNLKPLPNIRLKDHFANIREIAFTQGLIFDGEIYSHELTFTEIISQVMSQDKEIHPSIQYHIFDVLTPEEWDTKSTSRYYIRLTRHNELAPYITCHTPYEARNFYESCLDKNYEGIILRNPDSPYKFGRATINENIIYKFKQFNTLDVKCISITPALKLKDDVERTRNNTGHLEVVHTQNSFMTSNIAGSITVMLPDNTECNVGFGRGFSNKDKEELLANPDKIVGKTVEISYQPAGVKLKPRMPKLIRIRDDK